jgi:hypothetical protein
VTAHARSDIITFLQSDLYEQVPSDADTALSVAMNAVGERWRPDEAAAIVAALPEGWRLTSATERDAIHALGYREGHREAAAQALSEAPDEGLLKESTLDSFWSYEDRAAAEGSGMTHEQKTGATMLWIWLRAFASGEWHANDDRRIEDARLAIESQDG